MADQSPPWQLPPVDRPPQWFLAAVQQIVPAAGQYTAQLLWQRGLRQPEIVAGWLDPARYQPTSPFAFGQEMQQAVDRLQRAIADRDIVAIWGDFDADGVTATAVLWEGLGQFFSQHKTLIYYIPNRLTESHGLSHQGINLLHSKGCRLIVTCDTGSTNLEELEHAHQLGIDVIVTDHHTLPEQRPPLVALLNPRTLAADHPLATLSGVAVAYKLVEALYITLPQVPQKPQSDLLDLVAIGLIADLVELKGDCRYLAQRGIAQLQKQSNPTTATRPGVAKLLEFCKRAGDRPTDISFGLGPRINAVSRIQGDAHFCVELLTSQDTHLCTQLAEATELANARRRALQKEVAEQVAAQIKHLDLSTTHVIVLADEQWQLGVLGLIAGQIAQEHGRPTILLAIEGAIARGSARSFNNIDLYQLVRAQQHLLHRFGGHPYAAGLSLAIENLPLFAAAINQQMRQTTELTPAYLSADLQVTVADLGQSLFQELKLLEPCGIGNPVPRLLIQNIWFDNIRNHKIKDRRGSKIEYIKTEFDLHDDSSDRSFPGTWWGHYRDEIPKTRSDAVVELDFNAFKKRYELRLIALRPHVETPQEESPAPPEWLLDWRGKAEEKAEGRRQKTEGWRAENGEQRENGKQGAESGDTSSRSHPPSPIPHPSFPVLIPPPSAPPPLLLSHCPSSWAELHTWVRRAQQEQRPLAIAYPPPSLQTPQDIWQHLVGIAKYLNRSGKTATRQQLLEKLGIGDRTLDLGLQTLTDLGFSLTTTDSTIHIIGYSTPTATDSPYPSTVARFLSAVQEEQFQQQYFYQMPLTMMQAIAL
jgi:single-stranded-DNA-specific exonuclease